MTTKRQERQALIDRITKMFEFTDCVGLSDEQFKLLYTLLPTWFIADAFVFDLITDNYSHKHKWVYNISAYPQGLPKQEEINNG